MIGIIGAICGDIIGSAYEWKRTKNYDFKLLTPDTHITDDTICTMAVADWLLHTSRTEDELIDTMKYWCRKYHWGFGPMFYKWVVSESRSPYNSFGNGSAMRVSPVAWVAMSLDECIELAHKSAIVTHDHPEGIKGAEATAVAIYMNRKGHMKDEIINYIKTNYGYVIKPYDELKKTHSFNAICQVSVPAALSCWYYSNSYEDCIRKAVSLGGDADTEACIAGSICNANSETQIADNMLMKICENVSIPDDMINLINEFNETYKY